MAEYRRPVSSLVGEKPFILDGWISCYSNYARNPSRTGKTGSIDAQPGINAGRNTRCSRYGRPKHVALIRRPRRTDGRQEIETRKVIVFELRADRQVEPARNH